MKQGTSYVILRTVLKSIYSATKQATNQQLCGLLWHEIIFSEEVGLHFHI